MPWSFVNMRIHHWTFDEWAILVRLYHAAGDPGKSPFLEREHPEKWTSIPDSIPILLACWQRNAGRGGGGGGQSWQAPWRQSVRQSLSELLACSVKGFRKMIITVAGREKPYRGIKIQPSSCQTLTTLRRKFDSQMFIERHGCHWTRVSFHQAFSQW